jgi:hypothetical protein
MANTQRSNNRNVALQVLVSVFSALAVGLGIFAVKMAMDQEHRMTKMETSWELIGLNDHSDRLMRIETQYVTQNQAQELAEEVRVEIVKERREAVDTTLKELMEDIEQLKLNYERLGDRQR